MKTKLYSLSLMLLACALITGCPDPRKHAIRVDRGLNQERAKFDAFKLHSRSLTHLNAWSNALKQLEYDAQTSYKSYQKLKEKAASSDRYQSKLDEVTRQINNFRTRLDSVFSRNFSTTITVPQWHYSAWSEAVAQLEVNIRDLQSVYRNLYDQEPGEATIRIKVTVDRTLYDTRNDCVQEMQKAAEGYKYSRLCVAESRRRCTHQMDMTCVRQVLHDQGVLARRDGSFCATVKMRDVKVQIKVGVDKYGRPIYEEKITGSKPYPVKQTWFRNLNACDASGKRRIEGKE